MTSSELSTLGSREGVDVVASLLPRLSLPFDARDRDLRIPVDDRSREEDDDGDGDGDEAGDDPNDRRRILCIVVLDKNANSTENR